MIRKIEHEKKMHVKSFDRKYYKELHLEKHLITTYWFLFIPIFKSIKLIGSNL